MAREVSPDAFWSLFKQELRAAGRPTLYRRDKSWTRVAKKAANKTIPELVGAGGKRLDTNKKEYLHLDAAGWEPEGPEEKGLLWQLRVAFEHEHKGCGPGGWPYELCQLTDVVADLKVLIFYARPASEDRTEWRDQVRQLLEGRVGKSVIQDRLGLLPNSRWLFACGPRKFLAKTAKQLKVEAEDSFKLPYVPFTLDTDFKVVDLYESERFAPSSLKM